MPNLLTKDDVANEYGHFQIFHSSLMDKLNSGYQVSFYASDDGLYRCELEKGKRGFQGVGDTPRQALVRAVGADAQAMLWPEEKDKKGGGPLGDGDYYPSREKIMRGNPAV